MIDSWIVMDENIIEKRTWLAGDNFIHPTVFATGGLVRAGEKNPGKTIFSGSAPYL